MDIPTIILGVPIYDCSMAQVLNRIDKFIIYGRATGQRYQVATVDVDLVMQAQRDAELHRILLETALVMPSGMPLLWASHLLGTPVSERVTGADLMWALAKRASERGHGVYLLGKSEALAKQTGELLQQRYPRLRLMGTAGAPKSYDADLLLTQKIKATQPDILVVAFDSPQQEKWIAAHHRVLPIRVMVGVNEGFELITGTSKRAPLLLQKMGGEWLYSLAQQPSGLWKQYLGNLSFGPLFLRQLWVMRSGLGYG